MAVPDHDDLAVAIVGMGALFPGAPDLDTFWANVAGGVDAISDAPADRLDPVFFDPSSDDPDRFYCRRGGFLGDLASFDPAPFGIMPLAVEGIEPDQLIALRVAAAALEDAGGESALVARERTGVIIGRGGYLTPGLSRLDQRVRTAQQLVQSVRDLVPGIADDRLAEVKAAFVAQLGPDRPESAIDLVPNLTASRIANRLDLHGPAFTVDGACASSLLAVDAGVRELRSGRCDLVVAGGVHLVHDVTLWSVFTQLGALSPAGQIRPFDRRADGLLIGEGAGMVVLKRLEDADRDGDRVYAIVSGIGISSDGREVSLMKPSTEGQLRSVERAWAESGLDPDSCGLIEAHGTATAAGDAAELATLARFFGTTPAMPSVAGYPDGGAAVVGSVKSMIGHAMPAAGAAGLIKAALSVHYGVAPPTLHCGEPAEGVHATRFRTTGDGRDWDVAPDFRVAAVDAFGFGGINTHAVLRAHPDAVRRQGSSGWAPVPRPVADPHPGGRVLLVAGRDAAGVVARLEALDVELDDHRLEVPTTADGPLRLAIVDPTPARLDLARRVVTGGKPWHGRNDVWFAPEGLITSGGGVAFLFPGVEPNQDPDVSDVAAHFGWELPERMGESDLERQSRDILWAGRILHAAMDRLGVRPDVMAGHSLGEWSGLIAAGRVPDAIVDELTNSLLPHRLEVPDVTYLMVGAGVATAQAAVEDLPGVHVSHDNCVHQSVLCGDPNGLAVAAERLRADGVLCQDLPIRSGFHSPAFVDYLEPFRQTCDRIGFTPGDVPLWSATSVAPYPEDAEGVRALSLRHLVEPVRFRELAEALYEQAGARFFVQMGFGSVKAFVDDTLHDRTVATVTAGSPKRGALAQLLRAAVGLWAEGVEVDFSVLAPADSTRADARQPLRLGTPMVHLSDGPELAVSSPPPPAGMFAGLDPDLLLGREDSPVVVAYQQVMAETVEAGRQVMEAWAKAGTSPSPSRLAAPGPRVGVGPGTGGPGGGVPAVAATGPAEPGGTAGRDPSGAPVTTITRRVFSVADDPYLLDHCFYRQPDGWTSHADRFPVVPMTMLLEVMADAARALAPDRSLIGFDDVRALRWLAVAPPVEVTIRATPLPREGTGAGPLRIQVGIDGYAGATVLLDHGYPQPPPPDPTPLTGEAPPGLTADKIYEDRWLFHGPAYQGVVALDTFAEDGARGVLADLPAPGALLDCAGQLMGLWAMRRTEVDRLALPTSIGRIRFFGPRPGPDVPVPCTVRITEHSERVVRADLELTVDDRLWARIDRWEDRRFESDQVVWPVLVYPETNVLSEEWVVPGTGVRVQLVRERWVSSASRDLMMRRYLGETEREVYDSHHPRGQRTHLLGRMAAKDAVRRWHWSRSGGPLFPVEVEVANDLVGRPMVLGPIDGLEVSIAHTEWVAVAAVSEGPPVGVDIERVEPKERSFVDLALTAGEQRLLPRGPSADEWVIRAWTAKEAVAKARGTGLEGRPTAFELVALDGDTVEVQDPDGGKWQVATCRVGDHAVAVTVGVPVAPVPGPAGGSVVAPGNRPGQAATDDQEEVHDER
jgi:acyl transferase domain-containing protein/phosphopantetheinyl transferase (holo-ACP synthase)